MRRHVAAMQFREEILTQPKDIEGLRKVAEEATPGPWEVWPYGDPRVVNSEIGWTIYTNEDPDEAQRPQLDANARYIAAASPDVVLALLSELEAVKGENARLFEANVMIREQQKEDFTRAQAAEAALKGGGGSSSTETAASLADGKLTAGEATCPRCRLAALARDTLRARFVAELSDWDRRYDSAERLAEVLLHILTEDGHIIRFDPTHWQPLPPPPNPSARGEL